MESYSIPGVDSDGLREEVPQAEKRCGCVARPSQRQLRQGLQSLLLIGADLAERLRKGNAGCLLLLNVSDSYNKRGLA